MTLGGRGQGRDANFNMNFKLSFLIVGLELVSTRSYMMSVQTTLTRISATVFKSRYDYQLASSPGPTQILSHSRGEKSGEGLGAKLRQDWKWWTRLLRNVDSVS